MADDLPSGTVTLLFTDIEGSTRLLAELGDDYAAALAAHRRELRTAFTRHHGVEVDTQGDAFFVVFRDPSAAVAAAQHATLAQADGPLRLRVGVHTGEPARTDDGYVGLDVHRAARICATAHGGQVVLSDCTRRLLDQTVEVTDLGLHRLKDIAEPERLYQVGAELFPPLRSLNATNLPAQTSSLVGRVREVSELRSLVPAQRVTTLTGAGGSGKTRLALEVAAELVGEFPDGVFWVPLAAISDCDLVEPEIANTIGARDSLADHIDEKHMLLLLDNFEQLLDSAATLGALAAACPRLHLLTTSRAPLRIAGEHEYVVDPLLEPDAVALFRERAPTAEPVEVITAICRRLDDLPLAIELAAARTRLLPPEQLLERLDERLPLLTSGRRDAPARQRTLQATIAWSHELLSPEEQRAFRQLAAFHGGFTLEGAEEICQSDVETVGSLVEQSLVRKSADGRLGMLETIREFAVNRLDESLDAEPTRRRHADWCLALALSANLLIESAGEQHPEVVIEEEDNIRAAIHWALAKGEHRLGMELALAVEVVWTAHNPFELIRWLEAFAAVDELPLPLQARVHRACGAASEMAGIHPSGERYYRESLLAYRTIDDQQGMGDLLTRLAECARRRGDLVRARHLVEEGLETARRTGNRRHEAPALGVLGSIEWDSDHPDLAFALLQESAVVAADSGFGWWQGVMLGNLAEYATQLGRPDEAERWSREALQILHRYGDRGNTLAALAEFARDALAKGHEEKAGVLWGAVEAEEARAPLGWWAGERHTFANVLLADPSAVFLRGRATGRSLALDDAVAYALRGSAAAAAVPITEEAE